MTRVLHAYTDGSCFPNPGPCSAAAILVLPPTYLSKSAHLGHGTNNIGELTGVALALDLFEQLPPNPDDCLRIWSDSNYSIGVLSKGWKATKNVDLISQIRSRLAPWGDRVSFEWVKGHNGDKYNEIVDALAAAARKGGGDKKEACYISPTMLGMT